MNTFLDLSDLTLILFLLDIALLPSYRFPGGMHQLLPFQFHFHPQLLNPCEDLSLHLRPDMLSSISTKSCLCILCPILHHAVTQDTHQWSCVSYSGPHPCCWASWLKFLWLPVWGHWPWLVSDIWCHHYSIADFIFICDSLWVQPGSAGQDPL